MIGRYARITKDPLVPLLNGFAGKITGMKDYNGRTFYEITAESYGPKMLGKNYLAWKRNDKRSVTKEHFELLP